MKRPEQALAERIRELRRRHFGPRGKATFAERLDLSLEEYERFERGTVPPGEVLVRMCEATGEDLQWLLTGVASRGTVVISGTRNRHQELLTRLARLLDAHPRLAAPIEAFVDLLARGEEVRAEARPALPVPEAGALIPVFEPHELPATLPGDDDGPGGFPLAPPPGEWQMGERATAQLAEPAGAYEPDAFRAVELVSLAGDASRPPRQFIHSREIAACFPGIFGVRLADDAMRPMFRAGDAALAAVGAPARVGRPALCRLRNEREVRCRVWLGEDGGYVQLGRLADGELERHSPEDVCWSLEVLFRLAPAA